MLVVHAAHTWISSKLSSFYMEPHMLHTQWIEMQDVNDFFDDDRCRLMESVNLPNQGGRRPGAADVEQGLDAHSRAPRLRPQS